MESMIQKGYWYVSAIWNDLQERWDVLGYDEPDIDKYDVLAHVYEPDEDDSDFVVEYIKDIPAVRTEVERIKKGFYLK